MMKCEDAKALVDAWERGEDSVVKAAWSDFAAHLERCDRCAVEFGALLPLMERDAEAAMAGRPVVAAAESGAAAFGAAAPNAKALNVAIPQGFAEGVLEEIARNRPGKGRFHAQHARVNRWVPALAAAAALFIVGVGVGLHFGARGSDTVRVTFMLYAPAASKVQLAGDFSSWNPGDFSLKKVGAAGMWEVQVPLQRGRVYVYNFVIDGTTWITDPKASGTVNDGFGGSSSLLRL